MKNARKARDKRREYARQLNYKYGKGVILCPNCGQSKAHFVSPSLGESGFFICQKTNEEKAPTL